jgi:hypothetical protein
MDDALAAVARKDITTLEFITHHFPAERATDAWQLIESKSEPVLGVILDW